ncbi:MAG: glucose-6-phosphate isomerase [Candidatus Acidiferrales bacterium]
MSLPEQAVSPGRYEKFYQAQLGRFKQTQAISKIWAHQPELWKREAEHARVIGNRLGWILVLDTMRTQALAIEEFARGVIAAGLRDIVLLGMGGSSLAPEVFSLTFPPEGDGRKFFVLDSTDPGAVLDIERAIDLRKSLFIAASKSGATVETLSQTLYFRTRLEQSGAGPAGGHFIAITDGGSYLDQLATEYSFRQTFVNPSDIGGRYSALSLFGLVPAALWGADIRGLLDSAIAMREACGPQVSAESSPAVVLGALLGAAALEGADKLILLTTPRLVPLGNWIEQLVAESTGKEGKGIVPVAGGVAPPIDVMAEGCIVAALSLEGENSAGLDATVGALRARGVPTAEIRLRRETDLGAEFFKWELATALAGAALQIDPFDEPNVAESKSNTNRILSEFQSTHTLPIGKPLVAAGGIEAYCEGAGRRNLTTLGLSDMLRAFLGERAPGEYIAVLAYLPRNAETQGQLDALRELLGDRLKVPVLLGFGPRYMHSIGQLYKGGPATGRFVFLTSAKKKDLSIPGAKYTFGQLEMAQALGDLESLGKRGRPVLRLHLTEGDLPGLQAVWRVMERALGR